jgi:hypothetical protein
VHIPTWCFPSHLVRLRFLSALACVCRVMSRRSRHLESPARRHIAARHGWVHCVLAGGYFTSRRLSPLFLEFAWQKAIHPIASALPRAAEGVWREVLRRPRRHFLSYLALAMCTNACFCRVGYAPVHKQALAGSRMQCTWLRHWMGRIPSAARTLIPRYHPPCYIRLPLPLPLPFTPMVTVHRVRLPEPSGSRNASVTSQSRGAARFLSKERYAPRWNQPPLLSIHTPPQTSSHHPKVGKTTAPFPIPKYRHTHTHTYTQPQKPN